MTTMEENQNSQKNEKYYSPFVKRVIEAFVALAIGAMLFIMLWDSCYRSGYCSHEGFCMNNMKNIVLALHIYHDIHHSLPPAWTTDEKGNRLHSWRVLLLPYMDNAILYEKIRLSEPWDSEYNRQFHSASLPFLCCKSCKNKSPGSCNYSVIVDENGFFPGAKSYNPNSKDDDKIILIEQPDSFCWMDPRSDPTYEEAMRIVGSSINGQGLHYVCPHTWGCIRGRERGRADVATYGCSLVILTAENLQKYSGKWLIDYKTEQENNIRHE